MTTLSRSIRRGAGIYAQLAVMVAKEFMAFSIWLWVSLVLDTISMIIYVFFWRAIYADTNEIAGLTLQHTLNFILFGLFFNALDDNMMIWEFGTQMRQGQIAVILLRPLDMQLTYYAVSLGRLVMMFVLRLPMVIIATIFFGLQLPADPAVWGAFILSALLGHAALFFFYYAVGCLTFYITEVWGLGVAMNGLALFFSGQLLPLVMMPVWLRTIVQALPFAQAVYYPLSILTSITPLADAPQVWLQQLIWLVTMVVGSRLIFNFAIRKVTVQGG
jgi:ABC-2 type transport system permease protein